MEDLTKFCIKCGVGKPLDLFHKQPSCRLGYASRCKICTAEREKKYKEKNKDIIREQKKKYHEKNKEKLLEYASKYNDRKITYLADTYVTQQIKRQFKGAITKEDISPELIELKRNSLELKRIVHHKIKENGKTNV